MTIAGAIGMAHVELLAERVADPANPIWSRAGRAEILEVAAGAGVGVVSLCIEEPLDVALTGAAVGAELGARLVPVVSELSIGLVVLPMAEASDVAAVDRDAVIDALRAFALAVHEGGARVVLELTLPAAECLRFLDDLASPHVGLCYDVGNATAAGLDPAAELAVLGATVWHVHAKDKDRDGVNVRFGTGAVDFAAAFTALAGIGYGDRVTIEATRGEDPVATAIEHRAFLLALDDRSGRA